MYRSLKQEFVFPVGLKTQWKKSHELRLIEPEVESWMLDTGSLTDRLMKTMGDFQLKLVGQGAARLHCDEARLLRTNDSGEGWQVREVLLCDGNIPWVFARSVIPESLIASTFNHIGKEPLGKRLFNDKSFARGDFEISVVPSLNGCNDDYQKLWARRSCFRFQGNSLLVAEVFLPPSPLYKR